METNVHTISKYKPLTVILQQHVSTLKDHHHQTKYFDQTLKKL